MLSSHPLTLSDHLTTYPMLLIHVFVLLFFFKLFFVSSEIYLIKFSRQARFWDFRLTELTLCQMPQWLVFSWLPRRRLWLKAVSIILQFRFVVAICRLSIHWPGKSIKWFLVKARSNCFKKIKSTGGWKIKKSWCLAIRMWKICRMGEGDQLSGHLVEAGMPQTHIDLLMNLSN